LQRAARPAKPQLEAILWFASESGRKLNRPLSCTSTDISRERHCMERDTFRLLKPLKVIQLGPQGETPLGELPKGAEVRLSESPRSAIALTSLAKVSAISPSRTNCSAIRRTRLSVDSALGSQVVAHAQLDTVLSLVRLRWSNKRQSKPSQRSHRAQGHQSLRMTVTSMSSSTLAFHWAAAKRRSYIS
jgi:hypothetical protein